MQARLNALVDALLPVIATLAALAVGALVWIGCNSCSDL